MIKVKDSFYTLTELIEDPLLPVKKENDIVIKDERLNSDIITEESSFSDSSDNHSRKINNKEAEFNLKAKETKKLFDSIKPDQVKPAQNVYEIVQQFKLGSLIQAMSIPDYYVRFIIRFVIHISGALMHAHKHGLIHGHMNLSRVLAIRTSKPRLLNSKHRQSSGPNVSQ